MSKTPTQNEWEKQMRGKLLERLDFLSDHWVKGDDRPPFSFGGWREEVADDFVEIYKNYLADARKEGYEEGYAEGGLEGVKQGRADARKEHGLRYYLETVEHLEEYGRDRLMKMDERALGFYEAIKELERYFGLATLREEGNDTQTHKV